MISDKYRLKLAKAEKHFNDTLASKPTLPPLTENLRTKINLACPPATYRLICHLWNNNGARTDEIAEAVAIGNVSDAATRPRSRAGQETLGISLICEVYPSINRYGQATCVGRWWLNVEDFSKLFDEAVNDTQYTDTKHA